MQKLVNPYVAKLTFTLLILVHFHFNNITPSVVKKKQHDVIKDKLCCCGVGGRLFIVTLTLAVCVQPKQGRPTFWRC